MGNSLTLPCVRRHDAAAGGGGTKKQRRGMQKSGPACRRNVRAAARPRHVVPVADTPPEDGGDGGEVFKEAWRPGCRVEPAGKDGGVRLVKIVMRRKDITELVARLEQRDTAERNAKEAAELSTGLGGGVTMSPCRDAWEPRLSIIPEN